MTFFLKNIFILLFIYCISIFHSSHSLYALSSSEKYVGSAIDLQDKTDPWNNVTNILGNTTNSSANLDITRRSNSNKLSLTNFDLQNSGIPSNSIINGITLNIEWRGERLAVRDVEVYLTKDGSTTVGENKGEDRGQLIKSVRTYGGNTDTWGETWNTTDIFSSNFGAIIEFRNNNRRERNIYVHRASIIIEYSINSAPTDLSLSSNIATESMTTGSDIGILSSIDSNTGDTHTYTFGCSTPGTDDSSFSISGNKLTTSTTFNYNLKQSYNICLKTTDSGGLSFEKIFTIDVLDPNAPAPPLNFEILGGYTITSGVWNRQTNTVQEGSYAIQADNSGASNSSSCFERSENTQSDDEYKFWYKVSSEEDYDFLRFYDNGTEIITWSGEIDWTEYIHSPTAGSHVFRWCYTKDGSVSEGSDTAWIDNARVESPQAPGGVGGLEIWLKSNAGTSTTTNGGSLSSWDDQSGNSNNASAVVAPTLLNASSNQLNHYPLVDFNGSTQYMQNLDNAASTKSYFMVVVPDKDIEGTVSEGVPFGFNCESGNLSSGTCGIPFAGLALGSFTTAIPDEVLTHAIGSASNWRSSKIATAVYPANYPIMLGVNENAAGDGTDIFKEGEKIDNYSTGPYQFLTNADYNLGRAPDPNYPFYFDGKIAEIFNYSTRISDDDRHKIESYLSYKYGLTLDEENSDYIASDGSTMWSLSTAGAYTHDVFGIGRDDTQGLQQPESISINPDGVLRMKAIGEGINTSPLFNDINDKEFLSFSNNAAGNTWKTIGAPSGYTILSRIWKTQEVGELGNIEVEINVENPNFNIPVPSLGTNYYFVVDSNGNNDLSDETPILMSNVSSNIWKTPAFNPSHNRLFAIAALANSNNIPTEISLSNTNINENSGINFSIGTLTSTDADIGDIHTYSFVSGAGDSDNEFFSLTGNTLKIIHSADFEIKNNYSIRIETNDGNGGTFQKQFTININNIGESISSFIDFEDVINDYKFTLTSGNWSDTTTNPYQGNMSLESGNTTNSSQSCMEIIHTSLTDETMSFYYNVSSEANSDYLHFYVDNVQQNTWSGTVPWTQYTSNIIPAGTYEYKWCYIKDASGSAGNDAAFLDNIEFSGGSADIIPPVISATNFASGFLLPGGGHTISISYNDSDSGINTSSDTIVLNKWNGTSWGSNIATNGLVLGSKTVTTTGASYKMNNLSYGKYRYTFSISDNNSNTANKSIVFYIDNPEIIVNTPEINLGNIDADSSSFSSEVIVTVRTLGAPFRVLLDKNGDLQSGTNIIQNFNGSTGYGFESSPYSVNISPIGTAEVLASNSGSISINGQYNTYNYNLKMGALIGEEQVAGDYEGYIHFGLELDY